MRSMHGYCGRPVEAFLALAFRDVDSAPDGAACVGIVPDQLMTELRTATGLHASTCFM